MTETRRIALGFGDLYADAGDHIGHFYRSPDEWRATLFPFLRLGLEGNDKCVVIASEGAAQEAVVAGLEAAGIDAQAKLASGQLVVTPGASEPAGMQALLREVTADVGSRFDTLRWIGCMTWSHIMPTSETLMEWEALCNLVEDAPAVFLCQYELGQFSGSAVMDALKTHPVCVVGGAIHQNPYYDDPGEFLTKLRERATTP